MPEENDKYKPLSINFLYFIGIIFLMIWLGLFPSILVGYMYFITFPFSFDLLYLLLLIPLFFILFGIALLSSLIFTKIGIWIVHKRVASPKLGSYRKTMDDPQIRAHIIKGNLKNFGMWLYYFFHFRFLRAFWMRRMGVKIGKNVRWGKYTLDEEFIELGDNTFMSYETIIPSHLQDQTHMTIHPTILGKDCIFNPLSGAVGATIGDKSIFRTITGAMKGTITRGNAIYEGIPCKKVGEYSDLTPADLEEMKQKIRDFDKRDRIKEKNAPIKINGAKLFLMKVVAIIGGSLFAMIFPFLYATFFQASYSSTNHFLNIALLTPVPIIFIIAIGFFMVGLILFIKLFIVYYDRKAEIPEGEYELGDPRAKYFKIKYCLRMFGLRLFHGTPFRIADSFAMRFWGKVKFGKNMWMDYAVVDPQYLEIDDYTQLGQGARIHTHDIINGKLYVKKVKIGKNCLIGSYCHIKPGVEIADSSVVAVAAWFRKNRKCKRPALWMGKPAFELPLEVLTKSAKLKGKYVD